MMGGTTCNCTDCDLRRVGLKLSPRGWYVICFSAFVLVTLFAGWSGNLVIRAAVGVVALALWLAFPGAREIEAKHVEAQERRLVKSIPRMEDDLGIGPFWDAHRAERRR